MGKLKGYKKLNKRITKILEPFKIKKATCTNEYSYNFEKEEVTFKVIEGSVEDLWFIEFIKERFNYDVKYPFIISLLHEVGHKNTFDELGEIAYDFCLNEKKRISEEMLTADYNQSKKLEWEYFSLPDEILATNWAIEYAKTHEKEIQIMWLESLQALEKFFQKNGLLNAEAE